MATRLIKRKSRRPREASLEALMLQWINSERRRHGRRALRQGPAPLYRAARQHAINMASLEFFSHTDPLHPHLRHLQDRLAQVGLVSGRHFRCCAENLGKAAAGDSSWEALLAQAHQGLMQSVGHRRNILSPQFQQVGIGVVRYQECGTAQRVVVKTVNHRVVSRRVSQAPHWVPGVMVTQVFLG